MEVIDPGHKYNLRLLDKSSLSREFQHLTFVKREGSGYPGNIGSHPGTTTQEVLRALIDRAKYVDNQIHHPYNDMTLIHLRSAMFFLELRAAERHGRLLPQFDLNIIETLPTCEKCNHIGCEGNCHD